MARFTFNINGRLDLEPVSFDKVDKFYSSQEEFLRDSSVLVSTSRYSEMLSLVTFQFDMSKEDGVEKLSQLISMCRACPYVFIKSDAIEENHLSDLNLAIGSGYFMYAIREYEAEMNSSDQGQGVVSFSMRLQMVNWRPLAKSIKFISLYGDKKTISTEVGSVRDVALAGDVKSAEEGGGSTEYSDNPEDSNVLDAMIEYYFSDVNKHSGGLLNKGNDRSYDFSIGSPKIYSSEEIAKVDKTKFLWGQVRSFRVLKTVETSNTGNIDISAPRDSGKTKNRNTSEITGKDVGDKQRFNEDGRIYIGWLRKRIAGTSTSETNTAIQSIRVRRRNRFANQTVQGYVYPFCQYLGHSPTELLITTISNHEKGMSSSAIMAAVAETSAAIDWIRHNNPSLKGLDVMAVESPLVNAMGLSYVALDSSHSSTAGEANNVLVHNHTFIESDSYQAIENGKYSLASKVDAWNDYVNQGTRLLEFIKLKIEKDKTGAVDTGLDSVIQRINEEILAATNEMIDRDRANDLEKSKGMTVHPDSLLAPMVNHESWRKATPAEKVQRIVGLYVSLQSQKSATGSEERVKGEALRRIESAVKRAYRKALTGGLDTPEVIKALSEDIQKQEQWIAENGGSQTRMYGEGLPDFNYGEILRNIAQTKEYPAWQSLPALPFVYDINIISGEKLLATWQEMLPQINELLVDTQALIAPGMAEFTNVTDLSGELPTTGATRVVQNPDGSVTDVKRNNEGVKVNYNGDFSGKSEVDSTLSAQPGKWLTIGQVVRYERVSCYFREIRRVGSSPHLGVDLACPIGTPVYAPADGTVLRAGPAGGYGNLMELSHEGGIVTRYGHNSRLLVSRGQRVSKGQKIAISGNTGHSTGPHVHYEIRKNGGVISPFGFHNQMGAYSGTGTKGSRRIDSKGPSGVPVATKQNDTKAVSDKVQDDMQRLRNQVKATNAKAGLGAISKDHMDMQRIIAEEATKLGFDPNLALAMAWHESKFSPKAWNPDTKAAGLMQIVRKFHNDYGVNDTTVWDPRTNVRQALKMRQQDINSFKRRYHREPTPGEVYMMHQQGLGGFYKMYDNRNRRAVDVLGQAKVFKNGGNASMTVEQFMRLHTREIDQNYSKAAGGQVGIGVLNTGDLDIQGDKVAAPRSSEPVDIAIDPIPWTEEIQAESRLETLSKDFRTGLDKLLPTYKVYMVHGNNENSLIKLINFRTNASYYEIPAVRNIKVEMANQDNPVAVASFEVMNPLNTSSDPREVRSLKNSAIDLSSLESEEAQIITLDMLRIKAGNKIQIRMGYGNDPNLLPIVFNGMITETNTGEVLQVVAEGYGRELQNELLFLGDILPTFNSSANDDLYISAAVAKVLKYANIQHFGRGPRWFEDTDEAEAEGANVNVNVAQQEMDKNHAWATAWNTKTDEYFFTSFGGQTDVLENTWIMNVDMADRFFITKWHDIFPFGLRDYFPDFHVQNKTVWDVITTGRRIFPSSIALVKNLDGRSTTFTGIKEQMMIKGEKPQSLASQIRQSISKDSKPTLAGNGEEELFAPQDTTMSGVKKVVQARNGSREEQLRAEQSAVDLAHVTHAAQQTKEVDIGMYGPATNFHILSDSYNILSNQLRLNQNCITGAAVEYGSEPGDFGLGKNDQFSMNSNGGLYPAYVKKNFISDSSISSQGMAVKTAQGYLLEELEKMYDGQIIITGNPNIQPGDYAYVVDDLRVMKGVIKCREVQHVYNEWDGYITIITPGMFVEPATHLYSNLYMKFGIYMSFVARAFSEFKEAQVGSSHAAYVYNQADISPTPGASWENALSFGGNAAVTGLSGYLTYKGAQAGLRWIGGKVTQSALLSGWTSRIVGLASRFSSSIGTGFLRFFPRTSALIQQTITMGARLFGGGLLSGGFVVVTVYAVIIILVALAIFGFFKNLYESYTVKREMRHRSLLKMPLTVFEQEYTAGLFGWNNDKSALELQWENIKRTASNISDIWNAGKGEDAHRFRIITKLAMDE